MIFCSTSIVNFVETLETNNIDCTVGVLAGQLIVEFYFTGSITVRLNHSCDQPIFVSVLGS